MSPTKRIAITAAGDVPADQLLGYLVILVHHRFQMDMKRVEKIMDAAQLKEEYWPRKPRKVHAFRKACRMLQTNTSYKEKFIDPANGLELHFDVDYFVDVLPDGARQLSRKIQYTSGSKDEISEDTKKMLDIYVEKTQKEPEKMAIFEYDDKADKLTMTPIYSDKNPLNIKEMTNDQHEKLKDIFKKLSKSYTERYLKMAYSEMMYDLQAIPYCGNAGNIWFVPRAGKGQLDAFGKVYRQIHTELDQSYTWRLIPVIDTEAQRKYLKEDAEKEITKRYEEYLERLGKRLNNVKTHEDLDKIRNKTVENNQKFEQEMENHLIQKYSNILKTSIDIRMNNIDRKTKTHMTSRMKRALKFLETGK
jgi:hypothetical protein